MDKLLKFDKLKQMRAASIQENKQSVTAEHQKAKTAEQNQEDIDRVRGLNWSIEDVERYETKQKIKGEKADPGFTDYQQVAARKYKKLTSELKPNLGEYSKRKQELEHVLEMGLAENHEYKVASSAIENKPAESAVNKMVRDLDKTIEKRLKFSKRKAINPDDDVTYINDRNLKFNQKVSRAYDKYTDDIKAAFERGTALE